MRRRIAAVAVGALALSLIGAAPAPRPCRVIVPGDAETATPPTRACELRTYLRARGTWGRGRLGNVGTAASTETSPTTPSWDPRPPEESLGPWSGAASLSAPALDVPAAVGGPRGRDAAGATFAGTFTGNLDTLAADLYLTAPGHQEGAVASVAAGDQLMHDAHTIPASITLAVDGTEYTWDHAEIVLYDPPHAPVGTFIGRFAVTGLHDGRDRPRATHSLRLTVVTQRAAQDEVVVLYDATEVPSGIHFNRADVAGYHRLPVSEAGRPPSLGTAAP